VNVKRLLLAILTTVAVSTQASAAPELLKWTALVDPSAQAFEDPFRDLTLDQILALRTVAEARETLSDHSATTASQDAQQTALTGALAELAADGIDAEWLLEQRWHVAERRRRAATAGNPALDGETVTLGGFAVPAPATVGGGGIVYLVPQYGMCSHMPPPNPNQLIRVRLNEPALRLRINEPVRVTGRLTIAPTHEVFRVVDGPVHMQATYVMEAARVETLADLRGGGAGAASQDWARDLVNQLRGTGVLRSSTLHGAPQSR